MPELDKFVSADAPVVVPAPPHKARSDDAREERKRKAAAALAERVRRWQGIEAAGGIDRWIHDELRKQGLVVDDQPVGDKAAWKEKKQAEAGARRALHKLAWSAYTATHINHLGPGVHWHDHVDVDRFDIDEREHRCESLGVPSLPTPQALALALGVSIPHLRWLCTHKEVDSGTHYRRFTIPKRDGSPRTIAEPMPILKGAQRWLLQSIVEKLEVHGAAHGFLADRSIVSNARAHAGADVIVKVDIKDFFPSLTLARVKGLLRKAGLVEQVATLCALLATEAPRDVVKFRGQTLFVATGPRALPQGAPSSPMITNAVCLRLDKRLSGLARKLGVTYTRYADDITFSYRGDPQKAPTGMLLGTTRKILADEGFVLHDKKTAVLKRGMRQKVTGLVVNAAPGQPLARVPRATRRRLRAAIHNRSQGKPYRDGESQAALEGMAAFVYMTDPVTGRRLIDDVRALS